MSFFFSNTQSSTITISTLADLFSGNDGFAYEFDDLSTLWQDTSATTAVTTNGDPIARVDDVSGNGYNATQSTTSLRPSYNSSGSAKWADLSSDYWTIQSSTTSLKWAHGNSGVGFAALIRFGNTSNPDDIYVLLSSNGASTSTIGIAYWFDDRSSVSRNERVVSQVTNGGGAGTAPYNFVSSNGVATPNTNISFAVNTPVNGPLNTFISNSSVGTEPLNGSTSSSDSSYNMTIGAAGSGSFQMTGRIYQIVLRDQEFSNEELSAIESYFLSKL